MGTGNERQWAQLCDLIDRPDLKNDPRFATNSARVAHRAELRALLNDIFATRDAEEWLTGLQEAGLPCGPINTVPDVFNHPQAEARGLSLETQHPTAGPVRLTGFPYLLSQTPAQVRRPPPLLGQHTQEVLTELLGYSDAQVATLRERGAL
jgi:crotonobetainyl-CoA:carnitine CoA-transferase CaiB-like acyl-CoA transferase